MNNVMMESFRDSFTGDYNGMAKSSDTTFKVEILRLSNKLIERDLEIGRRYGYV
jgi:hypothetical protein